MDERELARRLDEAANAVRLDPPSLGSITSAGSPEPQRGWLAVAAALLMVVAGGAIVLGRRVGTEQIATEPLETIAPVDTTGPSPSSPPESLPNTTPGLDAVTSTTVATPMSDAATGTQGETEDSFELDRQIGDNTVYLVESAPTPIEDEDPSQAVPPPGVTIPTDGAFFWPSTENLPDECRLTILQEIEIAGTEALGPSPVEYRPGLLDGPSYTWVMLPAADGTVYLVVVVLNDGGASTEVSVTGFGGSDRTEMQDGRALLMIPITGADPDSLFQSMFPDSSKLISVSVTMADGTTAAATDAGQLATARCSPQPMPARGEQPADAAVAFESMKAALDRLVDPEVPIDTKRSLLNDWSGVDEAVAAAAAATKTRSWVITEHVFTSPSQVWFFYEVVDAAGEMVDEGYGVANLVDGEWQFRREMFCNSLLSAGGQCSGGAVSIGPAG